MARRGGDWYLLERHGSQLSSDPVPTDSLRVAIAAKSYEALAKEIQESSNKLKRLADLQGWTGKAAERFAAAAEDVAERLSQATERYEEAGRALASLVQPVEEARAETMGALIDAGRAAEAERLYAAGPSTAAPTPEQIAADQQRARQLKEAAAARKDANARLDRAMDQLDTARRRAAKAIRAAAQHNKDSRWDNIKGNIRQFARWANLDVIVKILGLIGLAIALVLLVVSVIATAPIWLTAAAIAVTALSLAANAALAISEAEGGSWTAVAMDALSLVTLGLGAVFTRAGKASVTAARDMMAVRAGAKASAEEAARLASSVEATRVANALRIASPTNPLRLWAEGRTVVYAQTAADSAVLARDAVMAGRVTELGAELAALSQMAGLTGAELAKLAAAQRAVRVVAGLDVVDKLSSVGDAWDSLFTVREWLSGDPRYPEISRTLDSLVDDLVARTEWRLTH